MIEETRIGEMQKLREKCLAMSKIHLILCFIFIMVFWYGLLIKDLELLFFSSFFTLLFFSFFINENIEIRYWDTKKYMFKYFRRYDEE